MLDVTSGDAIYDRYAESLLSFCQRLVRDPADAELALGQVFVLAASRMDQLHNPAMLRAWLFALARHTCRQLNQARDLELFDGAPALLAYRELLPLALVGPAQLTEVEAAAALGVPRSAAPAIIDEARRSGVLLGDGGVTTANAYDTARWREDILRAAAAASIRPPDLADSDQWINGWPPSDPAFAVVPGRRWGAPLAVLVVLLLALGSIVVLLATTGGGSKHQTSQPAVGLPLTSTSVAPPSTVATSAAAPAGASSAVAAGAAAPPVVSAAPTPPTATTAPPTAAAAPSAGLVAMTVTTDARSVSIISGRSQTGCAAHAACSFSVAVGAILTVADTNAGRQLTTGTDRFSAPASCVQQRSSCTFAVTSSLSIVLTTTPLLHVG